MDEDIWRVPLYKKAEIFERNILKNHWIDGLYPSIVEIPLDGGPVDQTTSGYSNVAHSVCWTANYLAGQAYRYAFTKDERVRRHADRVLNAMIRCLKVTGVRGLQARGYVFGHGESYEEREGSPHAKDWHQGRGRYSNLRWRGDPSHHNYSDAIHGYAAYYDIAADERQKEKIRRAVHDLVGYWAFNNGIIRRLDGSVSTHILGLTDGKTPNLRVIMAAAGLKAAHHITGDRRFAELYEDLVEQYGFRRWEAFPQRLRKRYGHDDAEHVFGHLDNLFRQEKDEELLGFYRKVLDALWENHKDDRQSLFTYVYVSLTPDYPEKERALKEALWTLQTWPIRRVFRPRMNSIRTDIEIVDGKASRPLPMYESPWDNEYQWKGSLYQLDGWLSRTVVSVAVPWEDPMVLYALEENGDVYKSVDGGSTWRFTPVRPPSRAISLSSSRSIRILLAACEDGFYGSTTAGYRWERLRVPLCRGENPVSIVSSPSNPNVLYAVTDRAVYQSIDDGERYLGRRWVCLTDDLPPSEHKIFTVVPKDPPIVYAMLDSVVYRRCGDSGWRRGGFAGLPEYGKQLPWLISSLSRPDTLYSAVKVAYEGLSLNLVFRSDDGGMSWNNKLPRLYQRYVARYEAGEDLTKGELIGDLLGLALHEPSGCLVAATSQGMMRSEDGGESWVPADAGLSIPRPKNVIGTRNGELFCGTPAGLYRSYDAGKTWESAHLVLIFRKNIPREVGNADFLDAYWMGRYYDFITEEQATQDPSQWDLDV